ncbi:endopeptidase La [Acidaminococcus sp. NSJ-142]|jgi:ATP-dependent Lon protease|uniref:endopeptidase La n=1 Tax=Acidaminococcus TaxID=904 RepID=UPI000CF863B9|nr:MULTISPECIES: endopeptidase La [Acidaminococcus]MCD2435031.1 endopeptidase La [Acidaminococcus hominis]RHK00585.1 endopeptidase La [Acidaminococcus sp. AM05-11]
MLDATSLRLPLLPLRGIIVFPGMIINLDVGRERSIKSVETAMNTTKQILLVTQRSAEDADPTAKSLYTFGVIAEVKQMLKLPNGAMRILVEGLERVEVISVVDAVGMNLEAYVEKRPDIIDNSAEVEALRRMMEQTFEQWVVATKKVNSEVLLTFKDQEDPGRIADLIAGYLTIEIDEKEKILEAVDVKTRLKLLYTDLCKELEIVNLEKDISAQVRKQIEQNQREYYLREQLKAINKELDEGSDKESEVDEYKAKMSKLKLPKDVKQKLEKELDRLYKMPPMMAESAVIRNYLDTVLSLPWGKTTRENYDLKKAAEVLDKDHYGLKKVKERILDYLAVRAITKTNKGPIICLVGPPGVGKTSLAESIARAVHRKFTRISLGGIRDEAEIRGHRRTYIGAMPGRLINGMIDCGADNPVFLLDEVDKLGADFRGDPASALLEVLDPEQNSHFSDHYIEFPYDMSNVFWIVTANTVETIPAPLLDRLEVIELSSYTDDEKLKIAQLHLLPKERKANGLTGKNLTLSAATIQHIIRDYTREAGVRNLERKIATVCRKADRKIVEEKVEKVSVTPSNLKDFLGPIIFLESDMRARSEVGVCTGLAWTSVGGELLKIEVVVCEGKGKLVLTGQLGDVMKESAQAAFTYIRSRAKELGLEPDFNEKVDIHIHVPEGAIPKDGPSAGITMATAMESALTKRKVKADLAMTGEITITGHVLPIGGLKEKVLAAHRYRVKTVLIPKQNVQDLEEIPENVRADMEFIPVEHMDQVTKLALEE